MYKVTIGVPVYNSSKLIRNALNSFVKQTMNKNDFEVICVDDCSTDNSIEIIEEYKDKLNLRIIKLDKNSGGPGQPRNKIIQEVESEFIFFVDSDDYISNNALLNSYNFAKENSSDIVLMKIKGVNGRRVSQSMFKETNTNIDLYTSRLMFTLNPLKLFKTQLLKDNNIFFPEDVRAAEDQVFMIQAYILANKISILADQFYYYATKHDGEHMTFTYTEPEEYYKVIGEAVDAIYKYSDEHRDRTDMLTASYINRHFIGSKTTDTTIKRTDINERKRWFDLLHNFVYNHVPETVDRLVEKEVYIRLTLARANDQANYTIYEYEKYTNRLKSKIKDLNIQKRNLNTENKKLKKNIRHLKNTLNRKSIKVTKKVADVISSLIKK